MHRLFEVLRFLNILEPGRPVLSITNVAQWLSVIGLAMAVFTHREIDLTTMSAFFATSALYGWKRFVLWRTGKVIGDTDYSTPPLPPGQ